VGFPSDTGFSNSFLTKVLKKEFELVAINLETLYYGTGCLII